MAHLRISTIQHTFKEIHASEDDGPMTLGQLVDEELAMMVNSPDNHSSKHPTILHSIHIEFDDNAKEVNDLLHMYRNWDMKTQARVKAKIAK